MSAPPTSGDVAAIYQTAISERRQQNIALVKQYQSQRAHAYVERVRILLLLQGAFFQKHGSLTFYLKQLIRQVSDWAEQLTSWSKALAKLSAGQRTTYNLPLVEDTLIGDSKKLHANEAREVGQFGQWLDKNLLNSIKNLLKNYRDFPTLQKDELQKLYDTAISQKSKQNKTFDKLFDSNDLLEAQFGFIDKIRLTDESLKVWGTQLLQVWQNQLRQQASAKDSLRVQFVEAERRFKKVYRTEDETSSLKQFWQGVSSIVAVEQILKAVWSEIDIEFISYGSKKARIVDKTEQFMSMVHEQSRIGSITPNLSILTSKIFVGKLQRSKKDWSQIRLMFSLDNHLLVVENDTNQIVLKVLDKGIRYIRLSENILELSGVEEGMIFNSTRRINIHFDSIDQLEEFAFYMEGLSNQESLGDQAPLIGLEHNGRPQAQ